jgi:hypothetical protein
LVEWSDDWV